MTNYLKYNGIFKAAGQILRNPGTGTDLYHALAKMGHGVSDLKYLLRGIGSAELHAITKTGYVGHPPVPMPGKDTSLCAPNHILNNSSQLLLSSTLDINTALSYAKLGWLPGHSCILKLRAPVVFSQEFLAKLDPEIYTRWDETHLSLSDPDEIGGSKLPRTLELALAIKEIDIVTNTPQLSVDTDFRPSIEDVASIIHIHVPGSVLSSLLSTYRKSSEHSQVVEVIDNNKYRPRSWTLSIVITEYNNMSQTKEFMRLMGLAFAKGMVQKGMRLLTLEDAASAFKLMSEAHPRTPFDGEQDLHQTISTIPYDIPIGSPLVGEYIAKHHQSFLEKSKHHDLSRNFQAKIN